MATIPRMGQLLKSRRFWTASLAAAVLVSCIWFSRGLPADLTAWLSAKKTDELYIDLHWAIWAVIAGVIIEEVKLLRHFLKFVSYGFSGRLRQAFAKAWKHKDEIFESIGFSVLVAGLLFELEISRVIETLQKKEMSAAQGSAASALERAANAELKTENLRKENLQTGMRLLPRRLVLGDLNPWLEELGKHPKGQAFIEVVPDWEAQILASDIRQVLQQFGHWEVTQISDVPVGYIKEGVTIVTLDDDRSGKEHTITMSPSLKAAYDLLERALGPPRTHRYEGVNWEPVLPLPIFKKHVVGNFDLKPKQVLILVGAKPLSIAFPMMGADPSASGFDAPTPVPGTPAAPAAPAK